jgi:hypothetical protein
VKNMMGPSGKPYFAANVAAMHGSEAARRADTWGGAWTAAAGSAEASVRILFGAKNWLVAERGKQ